MHYVYQKIFCQPQGNQINILKPIIHSCYNYYKLLVQPPTNSFWSGIGNCQSEQNQSLPPFNLKKCASTSTSPSFSLGRYYLLYWVLLTVTTWDTLVFNQKISWMILIFFSNQILALIIIIMQIVWMSL